MKRTTIEIPMRTQDVDGVLEIIRHTVASEGFEEKLMDGETVWAKGDGIFMKIQSFSASFTGHSVVLQGWMRDAITGDSDLEGFVAMLPKKKMKDLMSSIQSTIQLWGL